MSVEIVAKVARSSATALTTATTTRMSFIADEALCDTAGVAMVTKL
ncbi:MAG: hypothetical protein ABI466_06655 [Chloroflexota bacterium]